MKLSAPSAAYQPVGATVGLTGKGKGGRMEQCKLWTGSSCSKGFGNRIFDNKMTGAHRAAYCETHGLGLAEIEGKAVFQTCGNRLCINPVHLKLGTLSEATRCRRELKSAAKDGTILPPIKAPANKGDARHPRSSAAEPITLRSPEGLLYQFRSQKKAAEALGLDQSALSKLARERLRQHKGWELALL